MSTEPEYIETIEAPSDEEIEEFTKGLPIEEPEYHTLLEIWREILRSSRNVGKEKLAPAWATTIVTQYAEVRFKDVGEFRDQYFAAMDVMCKIVEAEVEIDDDALSYDNAADDAEHNAVHYKNLLLLWQMHLQQLELDWNYKSSLAGVQIAVLSELHKFFFGDKGLVQHLEQIQFQFDEDDQKMLAEALDEQRRGQ